MRKRTHTHRCEHCNADVTCRDTYTFNYDGHPEAWCDTYHGRPTGQLWVCEACEQTRCESGQAESCKQFGATLTFTPHEGMPDQGAPMRVCGACLSWEQEEEARNAEQAEERRLQRFYGSSDPQTDRERAAVANTFKR